ncbi:hypothetical protein [Wolbachia endosymbiont of Folsomia candida]|uniref:hypothetical protein n=1 Tax=Wolbachia endosymbiont of Folsomia candida TaxID=169402 RepID=UPI000B01490F|nr:hypothetical protein [Wolbachia endosymbiont of Folsomia candida]APR98621.1 hypothetical protein ASM33_05215 [Wolbachia endosymbiont of Folsomia candida]
MKNKKITIVQDNDLLVVIKQILHSFSKSIRFENEGLIDKKDKRMPSPQNVVFDASSLEEGLSYFNNRKSLNYPKLSSPFNVLGR